MSFVITTSQMYTRKHTQRKGRHCWTIILRKIIVFLSKMQYKASIGRISKPHSIPLQCTTIMMMMTNLIVSVIMSYQIIYWMISSLFYFITYIDLGIKLDNKYNQKFAHIYIMTKWTASNYFLSWNLYIRLSLARSHSHFENSKISNNSKSKNCFYFIDAGIINIFVGNNDKKTQKIGENS